ncbi:MAG: hypothetical protein HY906_05580 [Deltaproteobacteria bacterium]|nr:hypothetical protein [Deltaproteobacteria bacterium]
MGAVYEGTHVLLGRRVAIKFLHPQWAENPQALQRFYQEAQIAARLGHANICETTDFGRADDGTHFMVMPYLEGCSLGQATRAAGEGRDRCPASSRGADGHACEGYAASGRTTGGQEGPGRSQAHEGTWHEGPQGDQGTPWHVDQDRLRRLARVYQVTDALSKKHL